ncbi:MAG: prepilin-type N-terminal cleavage/methylation domain-containing protein [Candidatus Pacebacteria bacterium]|nr:prepilin-type N-terminal cleavage/methylation domain-containing protein [Candidatus Paceibacterota bacterium]
MLNNRQRAFTLVETLIGVALFLMIMMGVYRGYFAVVSAARAATVRLTAANLANEQFEIVRNLPYADVGIVNGIPSGKVPYTQTLVRGGQTFTVTAIVRDIDLPFDGTVGGSPNDLSPADNKLIEFTILCDLCANFSPLTFTGRVAPKNLETASTNGALFIRVFNANGVAIPEASVRVQSTTLTPAIDIQDVTNNSGVLQIVDIPPGFKEYKITVTEEGYSTATTYPPDDPENPNPTNPHATVTSQQVTQISFNIDELSTIFVSSVNDTCSLIPDVDFYIAGSKLVGEDPDIPKYSSVGETDINGQLTIDALEWDTYNLSLVDSTYDLIGLNPLSPLFLIPGSIQNLKIIVALKDPKSLLVTIEDGATQLPISDASVLLEDEYSYSETLLTGRGFITQTSWSGGGGQAIFVDQDKYFTSDGNIDITDTPGVISLKENFGEYTPSGWLESSTFDTGSPSNFHEIVWLPKDQLPQTGTDNVRFQIATGNDQATTTWNYKGHDGTATTHYTISNFNIDPVHNGDQYFRYKIYLQTADVNYTPSISDISFTFTSECTPPGQVLFGGLLDGVYTITVNKNGHQQSVADLITLPNDWQEVKITLYPE